MTLFYASDDDIDRLGRGLLDRTLPKPQWTHAGHFAAALWLMRHRPELDLARAMPSIIRGYNEATGVANTDTGGYHETVTQASLRAARAVLERHPPSRPLHEIVDLLMASPLGDRDWLLAHWSRERLFSADARRAWTEPDLRPLED